MFLLHPSSSHIPLTFIAVLVLISAIHYTVVKFAVKYVILKIHRYRYPTEVLNSVGQMF